MLRGLALLLLLTSGLLGCSQNSPDPHAQSIPDIPTGRSRVAPEAGEKLPVVPPGK